MEKRERERERLPGYGVTASPGARVPRHTAIVSKRKKRSEKGREGTTRANKREGRLNRVACMYVHGPRVMLSRHIFPSNACWAAKDAGDAGQARKNRVQIARRPFPSLFSREKDVALLEGREKRKKAAVSNGQWSSYWFFTCFASSSIPLASRQREMGEGERREN